MEAEREQDEKQVPANQSYFFHNLIQKSALLTQHVFISEQKWGTAIEKLPFE